MAHVQKFTSGSAGRIIGHCEREKSDYGDFLKYRSSSDIDTTKTHMNMSMTFSDGLNPHQRLHKRLSEVHVLKRKDVNVMCDWVITLPKEVPQDLDTIKVFFNESARFLINRYGKDNVISCNIHMDEAQPHMHFCFVPVVFDSKKNYYKVSAKEVLTRRDLNTFHSALEDHLHDTIGLEKGLVHSGVTKEQGGNKTIGQLKAETLSKNAEKELQTLTNLEGRINEKISELKASDDWKNINYYISELEDYQIPVEKWFQNRGSDIKFKRDKVTMPIKELEIVFKAVYTLSVLDSMNSLQKSLKKEIRALYDYDPEVIEKRYDDVVKKECEVNRLYNEQLTLNERFQESEKRVNQLWHDNNSLKSENNKLKETLKESKFIEEAHESLLKTYNAQMQTLALLKNQVKRYGDMFDRFPDLANQLKELYQKQIQHETMQTEKQKRHEKERNHER